MAYSSLREKISAEKHERAARYQEFDRLFLEAWMAGRDAARACKPRPMVVTTEEGDWLDIVDDGMCGFGWVNVPGNTSFGRWLAACQDWQGSSGLSQGTGDLDLRLWAIL
jgi:hypothetical protein